MKLHCTQRELSKAVQIASRAVAPRATIPILGNILLEAKEGQLRLSATNLEISMNVWIAASIEQEGAITVPARLLGDIVTKLLPGRVELTEETKTRFLHLTCGGFKARFAGLSAEDFPVTRTELAEPVRIHAAHLAEMIEQTAFAATRDQARQSLMCVQMQFGSWLRLAATDGFRLAKRALLLAEPLPEASTLVPAPSMVELARLLNEADAEQPVIVGGHARNIVFMVQGKDHFTRAELSAQLVDAKYPDYAAIIPKSATTTVAIDNATLLRAVQTARLFANSEGCPVTLRAEPGGCLHVSAEDGTMGRSEDSLDAEVKGQPVTICVSAPFLLDVLSRLGSTQTLLELTTPNRPVTIRPALASADEFLNVIMPMNPGRK